MMILRGGGRSLFFPYYDLRGGGGCRKFPTKMTSSIGGGCGGGGGQPFFPEKRKGNENMLLDALIIPVFYFISKKMSIKN